MTAPRCIITGCDLLCEGMVAHGDLFQMGDTYIFNSVTGRAYEPDWQDREPRSVHIVLKVEISGPGYFERRGVFVFTRDVAALSHEADAYAQGATS